MKYLRLFPLTLVLMGAGAAVSAGADNAAPIVESLGHVGLDISELAPALHFYIDQLGLREAFRLKRPDGTPWLIYLRVADSNSFIELFPGSKKPSAASASSSPDGHPQPPTMGVARRAHVPLRRDRIAGSAAGLAGLAGFLTDQGPVPAQGVAMVSQLLTDGGGPLYRVGSRDDLNAIIEQASQALIK